MAKTKHRRARRFRSGDAMLEGLLNISLHYGRDKGPATLARECKVPVQKIYGMAANLRKHGVKIPSLPKYGIYQRTLQVLQEKHPDLLDKRVKVRPI